MTLEELDAKMLAALPRLKALESGQKASLVGPATTADRQRMVEYAETQKTINPCFVVDWVEIAKRLGIQLVRQ